MAGFLVMLKMNIRLLLRNVGYLCFLIILPVVSIILLNIDIAAGVVGAEENDIVYIEKEDTRIESMGSLKLNIKVYDFADSKLSDHLLTFLQDSGSSQIFCYQEKGGALEEMEQVSIKTMNENTISAVMVIPKEFDQRMMSGEFADSLYLFYGNEDTRVTTLQEVINQFTANFGALLQVTNGDSLEAEKLFETIGTSLPEYEMVNIGGDGSSVILSAEQSAQMTSVKFSWAVITIAFLFSGVFISNVIITERNNGVLKRTKLSGVKMASYGLVKFCLTMITVIIQILVMGLGILLFIRADFGISIGQYLFITFWIAIVLNLLSVVIGILVNNLLSTSYAAFFMSSIVSLVAGLFIPMDAAGWIDKASLLTPHKWGIKAVETLLVNGKGAYGMYLLAITGFLAVIFSIGIIGLNIIQKEEV